MQKRLLLVAFAVILLLAACVAEARRDTVIRKKRNAFTCGLAAKYDVLNLWQKCRKCLSKSGFIITCGFNKETGTCESGRGASLVTDELNCPVGNDKTRTVIKSMIEAANRVPTEPELCAGEAVLLSKYINRFITSMKAEKPADKLAQFTTALSTLNAMMNPATAALDILKDKIKDFFQDKFTEWITISNKALETNTIFALIVTTCRNGIDTSMNDAQGNKVRDVHCDPCTNAPDFSRKVKALSEDKYKEIMADIASASTDDNVYDVIKKITA